MSIPDSGWIAFARKAEWWLLAAVTTAAAVVLTLAHFNISWFGHLPEMGALAAAIVLVLGFFVLAFKALDEAWKTLRESRGSKVRRSAKRLSQQQIEFLMSIFAGGSRRFELPGSFGSPRWFEELNNWNYIKWNPPLIAVSGMSFSYSITEDGWRELEKWHRKSG
ncbi:MAG: hypothetical protein OXI11_10970 [Gammaproteobacteria bacterium]|nr:hypothetical protein [Gammaproteobacteria bacterium]MXW46668.1 hypothetical protein [Gammaproteobacteria bacterium]MYD00992.1 hypothetical protein [Gammaproteobacteria bacterium]MYI24498.1 hypothetical protein [Gammaproteobacteria bacterium]